MYWQEFLTLPLYVHNYINPTIDTELLLMTGPVVVIALTVVITLLMQKVRALDGDYRGYADQRAGMDLPDPDAVRHWARC